MQKERRFTGCLKENKIRRHAETLRAANSASSTKVVSQGNDNGVRGRSQIRFGMTANFNNGGFTLIELLVVVLIIGILAAVAVPQYEMAVMRSRYSTLKSLTRALYEAEQIYHMANGAYTSDMEALAVEVSGCTLSSDKKTCTYPWGRCIIDATNGRVSCENTQTLQNGYAMYLGVGANNPTWGVNCWAFSTNKTDKYNQLCKKEGGVFKTTGGCTVASGSCQIYKISGAL